METATSKTPFLDARLGVNWRQNAIALIQGIFGLVLLPAVFDPSTQFNRFSSGITMAGLWVIAAVYTTMPMRMGRAIAMCVFCACCWTFIFLFRSTSP
jgi:hypothetical protein